MTTGSCSLFLGLSLLLYCFPYLAHCGAGSPGKMLHMLFVGTSVFQVDVTIDVGQL